MATPIRLAGPAQLANSATTIYTVPSTTIARVRWIKVQNPPGGSTRTFTLSVGADAAGTRIIDAKSLDPGEEYERFVDFAMTDAEIIQAFASAAAELVIIIGGDERPD